MAAEIVGGAFLSSFLSVLFDRLASQKVIDFFKGREPNSELLDDLKITMISVEGVLDDAEENQITRRPVRQWLDELKDAFYEADDLLDEIAYASLSSEMEAGPQTSISGVLKFFASQGPLEKIESKLVKILAKLQLLVKQKSVLGLKEGIGERCIGERLSSQKVQTGHLMDAYFCGREEDEKIILQLLLSDDANCNNLGIIPIVGMGGIGKTTLAQRVYNHSSLEKRFGLRAWISVSEEFNVSKVTWHILNGFNSTRQDFSSLAHVQDQLQTKLKGQKFLLVLDDVWNDQFEHWDILLRPLKAGAEGSKMIITTRLESVASVLKVQTHHLKKLSDEECWRLFSKHAFDGRSSSACTTLEKIGREIVRKCDGLPLAAKSLGGLLGTKQEPEEWKRVLKNNIWNLRNDNIIPALRLSYLFLPSPLKQCFAYCAIFNKGYYFEKEELVLLWMGEGFLGQASIERYSAEREVIGKEYFDDLVSRSFFNPKGDGFIMHDLINDLARSVAGEFCFRLDDNSCKVTPRTRHLSYIPRKRLLSNNSEAITNAPLLRTFLPSSAYEDSDEKVIYDILPKLERLRVLSLRWHYRALEFDDSISKLKHLRYLDLCRSLIEILPESLCILYHLEILILKYCEELTELPLRLGNLANLCILDIEGTHLQKMPPQMSKLMQLQRLSYFVVGKKSGSSIQELGNLWQLRGCLVIRNLQNVIDVEEALRANVKGKIHLKELELVWNGDVDDLVHARRLLEQLEPHENVETLTIGGYGGTRFPDWIDGGSSLLGVVTLELYGCRHCCQLPSLGQLVYLKKLSITDFPGIVSIGPEFCGRCTSMKKPFQCLEVLRFENMPRWQEWVMCGNEEEDFHFLQQLYIIDCPTFKQSLPRYLPCLTTLKIRGCERLVDLHGLTLSGSRQLSAFRFQSPLLERIEQLGCCDLFNTLQEVTIKQCYFLKCFPLGSFSNLKHLRIEDCPNFETINGNNISLLSLLIKKCPNLVSFPEVGIETPNLQRLELKHCSNLKWLPESMYSLLYSLEKLVIRNCPKLESFPEGGLPLKLERLEIVGCTELINRRNQWNLYRLPSPLKFRIGGYKHSECFPEESLLPPTLTSLQISDFPNLKSLEYKGYQHLTSLQRLYIRSCPELQLLPEEGLPSSLTLLLIRDLQNLESVADKIQQLTNLKELPIRECPKLRSVSEEGLPSSLISLIIDNLQNLESVVTSKIQQLSNLKKLSIGNCPKLKSVPEEGLPSTITSLEIWDFADLESLDSKGLQSLTSLKRLRIRNCPKLQSLPEEGLPSSLLSLYIQSCPLLEKRCEWEKGEDWPKISHISMIHIL